MNIIEQIQKDFNDYLERLFDISPDLTAQTSLIINTDENKSEFGDLNSNAAMVLAKILGKRPMEVAELIAGGFTHEQVKEIALHPPGFLNFFLTDDALKDLAKQMHDQKKTFFKIYQNSKENINIEFVSANPTGPLHVGHGRGAIIGDVLANVLNFSGLKATKEFYINNAGNQMQKLGMSFKIRCMQLLEQDVALPEEAYHGEYLLELAKPLVAQEGQQLLEKSEAFFSQYAEKHLLAALKKTLEDYGVTFDIWFPETKLHNNGEIEKALKILDKNGYLYEKDGATWFKATAFGDDKDRVLIKDDGQYTYASADVAYMQDKINRGFNHLIMILGHDHHSYLMRLKCIQQALGLKQYPLDIILYQLVKMKQSGDLVRMSKRAGNIVTLQDVIQTVGKDVARFFFLNRKADAQLEFNIDLAMKKTDENPVYYLQYAYVRTKSILQKAQANSALHNIGSDDAQFITHEEALLLKKMAALRSILETICKNNQTHLLTYYVLELANIFHSYYGQHRVIDEEHIEQSRGRLLLISILKDTFETVLTLLGISCPEKM
jgi:arginyl-tRNA synthetase